MASDSLLPLKILVYTMGVVLIVGFLYIVMRISGGMSAIEEKQTACAETSVRLPHNGTPKDARITAEGFSVTQAEGSTLTLFHYSRCGELLYTAKIAPR